jgi:alkyl hydroperoxide reductase subunit F
MHEGRRVADIGIGQKVDVSKYGEITIAARGAASLPGVYAAGKAAPVPFKQVMPRHGQQRHGGASALEHRVRTPVAA